MPEPELMVPGYGSHAPSDIVYLALVGDEYEVFIMFWDLQCGVFDLSHLFTYNWFLKEHYQPLREKTFFNRLYIDRFGDDIQWGDEYDIAAVSLYYNSRNMFVDVTLRPYSYGTVNSKNTSDPSDSIGHSSTLLHQVRQG